MCVKKIIFLVFFLMTSSASFAETVSGVTAVSSSPKEQQNLYIAALAKMGGCTSNDTDHSTCQISVTQGVDFLDAVKNCHLLGRWIVLYQPKGLSLTLALTTNTVNGCVVKGSDNTVPAKTVEKFCVLSNAQISQMTAAQSYKAMTEFDKIGKTSLDVIAAVQPLHDCVGSQIDQSHIIMRYNQ